MWPSLEAASRISDIANWALIVSLAIGAISAILILYLAGVKQSNWEAIRQASREQIGRLEAAVREADARTAQAGTAVAEADARAAEAAAQVVEANARATEAGAALALARFNGARTLFAEQQSRIVEKLRSFPPPPYDLGVVEGPEAAALMARIDEILKAAKWIPRDAYGNAVSPARATSDAVVLEGVTIEIAESRRVDWEPTVIALILALRAEGIYTNGNANPEADPSAIHVKIGSKPQSASDGQDYQHRVGQEPGRQGQAD